MAGVLLPTWALLIVLSPYVVAHAMYRTPPGLDRAIVFPMAVLPNVWGLWNVLYVCLRLRQRVPIGVFGPILLFSWLRPVSHFHLRLDLGFYTLRHAAAAIPLISAVYYLAWKYGLFLQQDCRAAVIN
jgi:hypothetical protein